MRCSIPLIPCSQIEIENLKVPFGVHLEPFAELNNAENSPIIVDVGIEKPVIRCSNCGAYISKYFLFSRLESNSSISQTKVKCNLCNNDFILKDTHSSVFIKQSNGSGKYSFGEVDDSQNLNPVQERMKTEIKNKSKSNDISFPSISVSIDFRQKVAIEKDISFSFIFAFELNGLSKYGMLGYVS